MVLQALPNYKHQREGDTLQSAPPVSIPPNLHSCSSTPPAPSLLRFRIHPSPRINEEVPMPFQVTVQRETPPIGFDPSDLTTAKAGDAVFWLNADHHTT